MRTSDVRASRRATPGSLGTRYLLFAGPRDTQGGLRDLVGVFDDDAAARSAFATLRLRSDARPAWAELGAIDADGNLALLCWFGHDRPVARPRQAPGAADAHRARDGRAAINGVRRLLRRP